MKRVFNTTLLAVLGCLLGSQWAMAQPQAPSPWVFTVDGGAAHQSEVDLDDVEGAFTVDRWFVSAGVDYGWSRRDSIGISVGAGSSDYEFDEGTDFGGGAPWGKIDNSRVSLTGRFGFGETGSMIIVPSLRQYRESGASSGDSQTYGLLAAAFWRLSDTLTIGPGLGVFSRLEDSTRVFPILAIDWDISERWNLSTGRGLAASQGPGLTLSYQLNPAWSFGLTGRYEEIEFRLDREGETPNGIGRDESLPLVLSARLQPNPKISLSVFMGVELGGTLTLMDENGAEIMESDYDPAALFGATFDFRF
jgi:hypothetical protein